MGQLVIALVGPQLAGKGKLVGAIEDWCGRERVIRHCTGDIIRQMARDRGLEPTRPNCDQLVRDLSSEHGECFLADAIRTNLLAASTPVVIFDSMRQLVDEQMVIRLPLQHLRVYVTAPPEVRYQRALARQRTGEHQLSWKEFQSHEKLPMERLISLIGDRANDVLDNGGSDNENDTMRQEFCQRRLRKYARQCAVDMA